MHCYEQIAPLAERMLALARTGQWGALPALEAQFSETVDRLKVIEPLMPLDEAQSARKYWLLSCIIPSHAELCRIVMPELARLKDVLKTLEQQQRLHGAYSQVPNAFS